MAFTVTDFIKEAQDGARPTLFAAYINWPQGVPALGANVRAPFLIKATSVPAMTLGKIEVPFMGRKINIAGDRTFADWTTTVINDEEYLVRARVEAWNNAINGVRSNAPAFDQPLAYRATANVIQFNQRGVPVRTYKFENIWPMEVATIDLSWESNDTIEEFEVTWAYDYFTAAGPTGEIGTDLGKRIQDFLG